MDFPDVHRKKKEERGNWQERKAGASPRNWRSANFSLGNQGILRSRQKNFL